jgi:glutathione peroxidase
MRFHRRDIIALIAAMPALPAFAAQGEANAHAFSFDRAEGGRIPLSAYRGKPILIVNTATRCGLAGQFAGLEQLWQRYRQRGLVLIAVPSNDFGGQEPLDGAAIAEAVRQSHGVSYVIAGKSAVRGQGAHPFYRWAAGQRPAETPRWNFHKYLIGRDGSLIGSFASGTDPVSPELVRAIGQELERG